MSAPTAAQSLHSDPDEVQEFLFKAAESEIKNQADAFNQLDTKTGMILGFALVATIQMLGFSFRTGAKIETLRLIGAIFFGELFVIIGTGFGIAARWPMNFDDGWSIEKLLPQSSSGIVALKALGLEHLRQAIKDNDGILEKKRGRSNWSHILMACGFACFMGAAVMMLFR